MRDPEVERLRRLRATALRVRAVANSLGKRANSGAGSTAEQSPWCRAGAVAWRVSRAASGRLRAHPYARFQRDEGAPHTLWNSVVAEGLALTRGTGPRAITTLEFYLGRLERQVSGARALTSAPDWSETLGRSQAEIRTLIRSLTNRGVTDQSEAIPQHARPAGNAGGGAALESDWPYLAL